MPNNIYIALIPLLPLASFVLLGLFGRKYFRSFSGLLGTAVLLICTGLSVWVAYHYFEGGGVYRPLVVFRMVWLQFSPGLSIDMSLLLDPISVMMIVVVSFVSLMVHIFSLGYMKGEERFGTYYAFLSLFTFSMLGLVLSENIFQIFIFWELVGCSSFLLIGYYYDRPSAVAASKKAFIVTRFADLGFLIGILILSFYAGTLDFGTLIERLSTQSPEYASIVKASFVGVPLLTWGLILVFIGGAGKSALFPLHIWLPDAMEGPTPVSALIHAATMVVAGVYLVARLYPVYSFADAAVLQTVLYAGALSALLAAIIACVQTDIKRVLAYSTMSQIGYMMFALGATGAGGLGYTASMFHLFTHAFFKALLFLCAGVIIHKVHSNDMKDMGGLRRSMPVTHICFLIACLAIAGVPPFSGFFSKEEILLAAFHTNKLIYFVGLSTSGLTAFYMFRLYFSVFWRKGEPLRHGSPESALAHGGMTGGHGAHTDDVARAHGEAPVTMKIPLLLLAVGAVGAGFVPFYRLVTYNGAVGERPSVTVFAIAPVLLALLGILIAAYLYKKESERPEKVAGAAGILYRWASHKFYIDEVYSFITKKIIFNLIGRPAAWIDKYIVDGLMNLLASVTAAVSGWIKGFQSGKVQDYALYFFAGIAGLAVYFIYIYS